MKKKFLALAALLCSATVCATVGAAVMNNNVQTVSAEATTSTWTDTATGTTYTFEGDISKFSTTDIGEIAASTNYSKVLGTEVGYTGGAVSNWAENDDCLIYLTDQAWTKTTNGIHFSFETNNVWRRPAGTNTSETTATRIEIYYGDLRLYLVRDGNNLKPEIWSRGTSTLTLTPGTNSNADTSMVHASANYKGAKFFVISPVWRMDEKQPREMGTFKACCDCIKNLARELKAEVIDGDQLLPQFPTFMADTVHPNDLGFSAYALNLLKQLQGRI